MDVVLNLMNFAEGDGVKSACFTPVSAAVQAADPFGSIKVTTLPLEASVITIVPLIGIVRVAGSGNISDK
jgi:hypothetical protein